MPASFVHELDELRLNNAIVGWSREVKAIGVEG